MKDTKSFDVFSTLVDLTEKFVIKKKDLNEIEFSNIPRNIESVKKSDKNDIVKNQKSRFAIWCLIIFATRFHIIVPYLHFVVINAFIKFSFSDFYIQARFKSYFILLCKEYEDSSSAKASLIFKTTHEDIAQWIHFPSLL